MHNRQQYHPMCLQHALEWLRPSFGSAANSYCSQPFLCHVDVSVHHYTEMQLCCPQVLGLLTLRFFAKLLPLVLRWCHDDEPAVQLAALQALQEIVRFTWPRMTAHANFLLLEIQGVAAQHGGCSMVSPRRSSQQLAEDTSETHLAIKSCLCNITDMLYLCGGPVLQQQLCNSKQMPGETGRVQGGQVA